MPGRASKAVLSHPCLHGIRCRHFDPGHSLHRVSSPPRLCGESSLMRAVPPRKSSPGAVRSAGCQGFKHRVTKRRSLHAFARGVNGLCKGGVLACFGQFRRVVSAQRVCSRAVRGRCCPGRSRAAASVLSVRKRGVSSHRRVRACALRGAA